MLLSAEAEKNKSKIYNPNFRQLKLDEIRASLRETGKGSQEKRSKPAGIGSIYGRGSRKLEKISQKITLRKTIRSETICFQREGEEGTA